MKALFTLMILVAAVPAMAGKNNDVAREVCVTFSKVDYPETYKKCLKVASQGDYNAAAARTCVGSLVSSSPMDRVACLETIRGARFDNRAVAACLNLTKQYYHRGIAALYAVKEKYYTNEEAAECGEDAECWATRGTPLPVMPGFD